MIKLSKYNPGIVAIVKSFPQDKAATALSALGVVSKTGKPLSASHVSNFLRNDLGLRRVRKYRKPNYQGKNWHSFE